MDTVISRQRKLISFLTILIFIIITILFIYKALYQAQFKYFWTDESFGLQTAQHHSFGEMIFQGVSGQGSPAPLDYLILKIQDILKNDVNAYGLPFNIYYRLHTIAFTAFLGMLTILTLFKNIQKNISQQILFYIQSLLLTVTLASFYFNFTNFHYAIETRPYALWNGLWFCCMLLLINTKNFNKTLIGFLTLLSLTATAALFQHLSLMLSYIVFSRIQKEKFSSILRSGFKIFIIPISVSLYYILCRKLDFNWSDDTKYEFFIWWKDQFIIGVWAIAGIILSLLSKKHRKAGIPFLAMLILLATAPFINELSYAKGFFFSPRHYIYLDLIYPMLLAFMALTLPELWEKFSEFSVNRRINLMRLIVLGIVSVCSFIKLDLSQSHIADLMLKNYKNKAYYLIRPNNKEMLRYNIFYYHIYLKKDAHDPAALGLIAYNHYLLGHIEKARTYYLKSIKYDPDFFWYLYNLAIIDFRSNNYKSCQDHLTQAISLDPQKSADTIASSKIYLPVLAAYEELNHSTLKDQFFQARINTLRLLVASYYHLGKFEELIHLVKNPTLATFTQNQFFEDAMKLAYLRLKLKSIADTPQDNFLKENEKILFETLKDIPLEAY